MLNYIANMFRMCYYVLQVQGFENKAKNGDFRMSFDDVFTFYDV